MRRAHPVARTIRTNDRPAATIAAGRLLAIGILLAVVAACSGDALVQAPAPVATALDPFQKDGYVCSGPSSAAANGPQWECDLYRDGVATSVVVDGDQSGIRQVTASIDQHKATEAKPDTAKTFFDKVTSDVDVNGGSSAVHDWVTANVTNGGQQQVGSVHVTLDGFGMVDHLVVSGSG